MRGELLCNVHRQHLPPYREQKKNLDGGPDSDQQTRNSLDPHPGLSGLFEPAESSVQFNQEPVQVLDQTLGDHSAPPSFPAPSGAGTSTEAFPKSRPPLFFDDQELTATDLNENCAHAVMTAGTVPLPGSPFRHSVLSTIMALALTPPRTAMPLASPQHTSHQQHDGTQDHFSNPSIVESNSQGSKNPHTVIEMPDTGTYQQVTTISQQIHERRLNTQLPNIETRATPPLVSAPHTWRSQAQSYWTIFTSYATPTTITVAVIMPILLVSCIFLL